MPDPRARKAENEARNSSRSDRLEVEGKYSFAVVGLEYFKSSGKKTPGLNVRCVVLDGEHMGSVIDTEHWLTGEMKSLCDMVLAHGYEEPFDENNAELLGNIVARVPSFIGVVKNEPYMGRNKFRIAFWNKARTTVEQPHWDEVKSAAYDGWDRYLLWRRDNPRGTYNGPSNQGSSGRNTGNDVSPPPNDNDIPF